MNEKRTIGIGILVLLAVLEGCLEDAPSPGEFSPVDVEIGDQKTCYWHPEFITYEDVTYMVWLEGWQEDLPDGRHPGTVWHCLLDPDTGKLIPPDGRGFKAFESTIYSHANPGIDAYGPFYIGMNLDSQLVIVRPTGPHTGDVAVLPTTPDPERRAIWPSCMPDQKFGYVLWIKSHDEHPQWREIRYIDLRNPAEEIIVERQGKQAEWIATDVCPPRWFYGLPVFTYGFTDHNSYVQCCSIDVSKGSSAQIAITNDPHDKIDSFPAVFEENYYLFAGISRSKISFVYKNVRTDRLFSIMEVIEPSDSTLREPCLAQSHEAFVFNTMLYTTYQLSDCHSGSEFLTAREIWLSSLREPVQQWRLTRKSNDIKIEPEPFVGTSQVWVYYISSPEGSDPYTARWALRRCETPLTIQEIDAQPVTCLRTHQSSPDTYWNVAVRKLEDIRRLSGAAIAWFIFPILFLQFL
jgi:hypothetical protein